jgi:hypothetical protein
VRRLCDPSILIKRTGERYAPLRRRSDMVRGSGVIGLIAFAALAGGVRAASPPGATIDPVADRMLKQMTDYLASLKSFRVQTSASDEVVTRAGQKLQISSSSEVSVRRPDRLRSEQIGAANALAFWYDGKRMTLTCKADGSYATLPAPANIDSTIDKARRDFQIDAPGADLLYSHPYDILTEQVTGGKFIGRESVNGVAANHLAFTGEEVDWEIWIQDGPQPLPLRFVITSKTVKGEPQFEVQMSNWEPQARLGDDVFEYQAPANAKHLKTFSTSCTSPAR